MIFGLPFAAHLEHTSEDGLAYATEITLPAWRRRTLFHGTGDRLARLLSPVLQVT